MTVKCTWSTTQWPCCAALAMASSARTSWPFKFTRLLCNWNCSFKVGMLKPVPKIYCGSFYLQSRISASLLKYLNYHKNLHVCSPSQSLHVLERIHPWGEDEEHWSGGSRLLIGLMERNRLVGDVSAERGCFRWICLWRFSSLSDLVPSFSLTNSWTA